MKRFVLLATIVALGASARGLEAQSPPRLYYEIDGAGPAVVFVEDWAQDTTTWFRILPLLRPGRQLVRYDLRGQGRSAAPADGDYSLDVQVADLLRTLDALAIERAHIVASGLGARIALGAALEAPDRIASLALINPHLAWTAGEIEWWERFLGAHARMGGPSLAEYSALLVGRWFEESFAARETWVEAFYDLILRRQPPHPLIASLRSWLSSDLSLAAAWSRGAPLLLVQSGAGPGLLGEARLRSGFPDTRKLVIPGSRRMPQLDAPEDLGRALDSFLPSAGYSPLP